MYHRTTEENNLLENILDLVQNDNDNFKPCIATLKLDTSIPNVYNLHDNIPPYNYQDNNNNWIDSESAYTNVIDVDTNDCYICGEMFDGDTDEALPNGDTEIQTVDPHVNNIDITNSIINNNPNPISFESDNSTTTTDEATNDMPGTIPAHATSNQDTLNNNEYDTWPMPHIQSQAPTRTWSPQLHTIKEE